MLPRVSEGLPSGHRKASQAPRTLENRVVAKARARFAKLDKKLSGFLESVNAEKPEDAYNWETVGKQGKERTKFFKRYDK